MIPYSNVLRNKDRSWLKFSFKLGKYITIKKSKIFHLTIDYQEIYFMEHFL